MHIVNGSMHNVNVKPQNFNNMANRILEPPLFVFSTNFEYMYNGEIMLRYVKMDNGDYMFRTIPDNKSMRITKQQATQIKLQ